MELVVASRSLMNLTWTEFTLSGNFCSSCCACFLAFFCSLCDARWEFEDRSIHFEELRFLRT